VSRVLRSGVVAIPELSMQEVGRIVFFDYARRKKIGERKRNAPLR